LFWQVGAPPQIARFLDEIRRENDLFKHDAVSTYWGADPELDEFMVPYPTAFSPPPPPLRVLLWGLDFYDLPCVFLQETYCDLLVKYKSDLERPFDEATTFLNKIEMQFRNICTAASTRSVSGQSLSLSLSLSLQGKILCFLCYKFVFLLCDCINVQIISLLCY